MSTSDTSKNSSYYLTARYGSPDGVGLQANANAGWTFTMSDFLVAAGVGANLLHLNFDYDAQRTLLDDAYQLSHQVGMSLRHYTEDNRFLHKQNVTTVRLAVPLGLEYELVKHCHVRAGWVAEFLRTANEDKSTENGFDVTSNQINLSTVTFGMGYQIFEKLRADFVNVGDIAQPRNWNLSAIYTFGAAE
jgi:opacity protein-like surface antigen